MARKSNQPPQATEVSFKSKALTPRIRQQDHRLEDVPTIAPLPQGKPPLSLPIASSLPVRESPEIQLYQPSAVDEPLLSPDRLSAQSLSYAYGDGVLASEDVPNQPTADGEDHGTAASEILSLTEVTRLLRVQQYRRRKCHQAQSQLHALQFAAARSARLLNGLCSIRSTLAECIRSEDKLSFANLHDAFQDACTAVPGQNDGAEPDVSSTEHLLTYPSSFMDGLSGSSHDAITDFLAKVRHDGTFIADRMSALSHKELLALLPEKQKGSTQESVFGTSGRGSSRLSKPLGYVVDSQLDQLSTCGFASSLESLICTTRAIGGHTAKEKVREMDTWATVAAKLIVEQKPGSEKLVPVLLNLWSGFHTWPGSDRLGQWISQTLQDGWFLLEQPTKPTFRMRVQGRPEGSVEDEVRTEAFYTRAVNSLLDLLGDTSGASLIPGGAIALSRAISRHLSASPGHQRAFPRFVMTRWLFPAFFHEAITLPEAHGLLSNYYISDLSRQRILREIAVRAQKVVLDVAYTWKYGNTMSSDAAARVNAITRRFEDTDDTPAQLADPRNTSHAILDPDAPVIAMTASDVLGMVEALYPVRRPSSLSSDRDILRSGLQSSASSISGFSMFKGANGSETTLSSFPTWSNESLNTVQAHKTPNEVQPTSLNADRMAWEDGEAQSLREACSDLEETVNRTQGSPAQDSSQWTFLVSDVETQSLSTMRQILQAIVDDEGQSEAQADAVSIVEASSEANPADSLACSEAVEKVLLSYGREEDSTVTGLPHDSEDELFRLRDQLLDVFDDALEDCHLRSDFLMAHEWFYATQNLEILIETSGISTLRTLLGNVELGARTNVGDCLSLASACSAKIESLKVCNESTASSIACSRLDTNRLRDKMWYVADIRTSGAYDEIRCIAAALKVMGKPKRPNRTAIAPPLRHWTGPKLSSQNMHLKTESQILELLSAAPKHGGPNKLSDEQSRSVSAWLEKEHIHNFCRGEERLHKLCMELCKCVDTLVPSRPTDSPVIASTVLFARERAATLTSQTTRKPAARAPLFQTSRRFNDLAVQTSVPQSIDAVSSASQTLSSASSRDYFDHRSPTLTTKSSATFWSPAVTDAQSPSSATSIASHPAASGLPSSNAVKTASAASNGVDASVFDKLRQTTISLLISDLGTGLFAEGCETDQSFCQGLGGQLFDLHIALKEASRSDTSPFAQESMDGSNGQKCRAFDYEDAFARIMARFSASTDPYAKLGCLCDVDALLQPYMASRNEDVGASGKNGSGSGFHSHLGSRTRSGTANVKVSGFKKLFKQKSLRPPALFRDLQLIASLLPPALLETGRLAKAFWHAGIAATELKQEARTLFVETADSIIAYHTSNRGSQTRHPSAAQQQRDTAAFSNNTNTTTTTRTATPSRPPSSDNLATYTIPHAASLLLIAAREGDAVAQRELGTLYLTHPDLMDHVLAPFARGKEVFKEELESKWRRNMDPERCDPGTMCVAHHWMVLSAKGGDLLAGEFLRQREEMERLG